MEEQPAADYLAEVTAAYTIRDKNALADHFLSTVEKITETSSYRSLYPRGDHGHRSTTLS